MNTFFFEHHKLEITSCREAAPLKLHNLTIRCQCLKVHERSEPLIARSIQVDLAMCFLHKESGVWTAVSQMSLLGAV